MAPVFSPPVAVVARPGRLETFNCRAGTIRRRVIVAIKLRGLAAIERYRTRATNVPEPHTAPAWHRFRRRLYWWLRVPVEAVLFAILPIPNPGCAYTHPSIDIIRKSTRNRFMFAGTAECRGRCNAAATGNPTSGGRQVGRCVAGANLR